MKIISYFLTVVADAGSEEFFVVKDYRGNEVLIHFSISLRGKPAIMANGIRFTIMSESNVRVLWRCSLMSTKTRKCPARITMNKGNPPTFVLSQCHHEHMSLVRGKNS
jgi:hypothetical protein